MKNSILIGTLLSARAAAQRYTYTTRTITECFSSTQADFGQAAPTQGPDKYWTIEMPECHDCHCTDCAYTHTYTTTLDVFYPMGIGKYPYSIKEIYRGMSTMPVPATPTAMPYGFTSAVETCNICGDEPVEATMTYPRGGSPYQEHIPSATATVGTMVEPPSTLQTKVADQETAVPSDAAEDDEGRTPLEKTVIYHKGTKFHDENFSDYALELGSTGGDDEDEASDSTKGSGWDQQRNKSKLPFSVASTKDSDGAATSVRPAAGAGLALLLPLVLLL
ncbi:hypothetical protein ACJ41O_013318 [Fusarium nematophilum]